MVTDFGSARKLELHLRRKDEGNVLGTVPPVELFTRSAQKGGVPPVKLEECGTFMTLTGTEYTLRWAAPELINEEASSLASDMWAVAWICWEVR